MDPLGTSKREIDSCAWYEIEWGWVHWGGCIHSIHVGDAPKTQGSPAVARPVVTRQEAQGCPVPFYLLLYHKLIHRQHVSSMSLVTELRGESHRSTPPGRSRQVFHMHGVSSLLIECSQSIWPRRLDRIKQSSRTMRACNLKALFN